MEKNLRRSIQRKLDKYGVFHVPGSVLIRGCPDILCCYQGLFIGIELKMPGRKPTPSQEAMLRRIRKCGGFAAVVESSAEFDAFWEEMERFWKDQQTLVNRLFSPVHPTEG